MNPKLLESLKIAGWPEWTEVHRESHAEHGYRLRASETYRWIIQRRAMMGSRWSEWMSITEHNALALIEKHLRERLADRRMWIWRPAGGIYTIERNGGREVLTEDGWKKAKAKRGEPDYDWLPLTFDTYLDALIAATLAAGKET